MISILNTKSRHRKGSFKSQCDQVFPRAIYTFFFQFLTFFFLKEEMVCLPDKKVKFLIQRAVEILLPAKIFSLLCDPD